VILTIVATVSTFVATLVLAYFTLGYGGVIEWTEKRSLHERELDRNQHKERTFIAACTKPQVYGLANLVTERANREYWPTKHEQRGLVIRLCGRDLRRKKERTIF
jgi:hypothetical protein